MTTSFATARQSQRPAIALVALFLAITGVTCIWTIGRIKDALAKAILHGAPSPRQAILATLGSTDFLLIAASIAAGLLLLAAEQRKRIFSHFIANMSSGEAFIVLTMITAWTGQCYVYPGVLLGGDTATHISRLLEVSMGLHEGHFPLWTNYQYLGEPLLWFTGPLFYLVGGLVTFVAGDPTVGAKTMLFTLHILTAWSYYALGLRFGFSRLASTVAAICYSSCFAVLHLFLYRGVFPQAFTILFLITLFYAADGLLRIRRKVWADTLIFGLSTAGLIINHQPHALFAALYLFIFGGMALVTGFWTAHGLHRLIIAGLLGVVASLAAVLPTIVEANWVMIVPGQWPIDAHLPTLKRLGHLLVWRDVRTTWGFDYWAYLGIGIIVGTIAGLTLALRGRFREPLGRLVLSSAVCFLFCFFLYNQTVRDILYLAFFAGLIGAGALTWAEQSRRHGSRALLLVATIAILDVMSTSIQPVARTDKDFLIQAGLRLHQISPNERVIQIILEKDKPPTADVGPDNSAASYEAPVGRLAGNHNMAATHVHNYLLSIIKRAETELRQTGALHADALRLLAMLNVSRVICNSPVANGCPSNFANTVNDPVLGNYIPIPGATPVIFSRRVVPGEVGVGLERPMLWAQDFDLASNARRIRELDNVIDTWNHIENTDLTTRQAKAIPVRGLPTDGGSPNDDSRWNAQLVSYSVKVDSVTLHVHSDAAGFAQLAYPWYPGMQVTVNTRPTIPLRGLLNLMVVPIKSGDTTIRLHPAITTTERDSLAASALGFIGLLIYTAWLARAKFRATT